MSVNLAIILGYLGNDPEMIESQNGTKTTTILVATNDYWNHPVTGEKKESTEWHSIVFHNRLAEVVTTYLKKGDLIYVEGNVITSKWQENGITKYMTEIHAKTLQMLGSKKNSTTIDNKEHGRMLTKRAKHDPYAHLGELTNKIKGDY